MNMHTIKSLGHHDHLLEPLLAVLNNQTSLFNHWDDSESASASLMTAMIPWVIRDHPHPLQTTVNPKPYIKENVDCHKRQYANVLTGTALPAPRIIVDFIPFGYDVDKLEIRFYELYDVVDAFVLYESPYTQKGNEKPLYYSLVKDTPRFSRFSEKVIHLIGTVEELRPFKARTISGMKSNQMRDMWSLEYSMRTEMIRKFSELQSPLKTRLTANSSSAYATQSDADEIPTGDVSSPPACPDSITNSGFYSYMPYNTNNDFLSLSSDVPRI